MAADPAPAAGHCRTCGALMQHRNGHWTPVAPARTCRFGATAHTDVASRPADADLIRQGRATTTAPVPA